MYAPAQKPFAVPCRQEETYRIVGFTLSGGTKLESLARFYGFAAPARERELTLGDYVARSAAGNPTVGQRARWERVELVALAVEEGTITRVRMRLVPLRERRGEQREAGARGPMRRSIDRARPMREMRP